MLSKKASLLLLIGTCAWLASFFYQEIGYALSSNGGYRSELFSWLLGISYMLMPVPFIALAIAGLKQRPNHLKTIGILLTISCNLWLACILFSHIRDITRFSGALFSREDFNLLSYILRRWVDLLGPFSFMLLGIALIGDNPKRLKRNATWLVAGSLIYLFTHLCFCIQELILNVAESYERKTWDSAGDVLRWIALLFPAGTIAAGISILRNTRTQPIGAVDYREDMLDSEPVAAEIPETTAAADPTVTNWFSYYLLSGIPVVGSVFLFIWAIDHDNRIRRNWAVTYFMAGVMRTLLNLIFVVPYFLFSETGRKLRIQVEESDYLTFAWTAIFLLIAVGSVMLILHFNHKPDRDNDPDDPNPTIAVWVSNFLILAVPLVGLICLIVWAADNRNAITQSWAQARLLWSAAMLVFSLYLYVWITEIISYLERFVYFQF